MWIRVSFAGAAIAVVLLTSDADTRAAGFAIDYESARAIGMATAGSASAADSSTIFYNPAGLSFVELGNSKRSEVLFGGQFLSLHNQFTDEGSTLLGGLIPTPGASRPNGVPPSFVPWLFGSYRLTPKLTAGVGVFSPWGLRTDWGPLFVGRYQNEVSSLGVLDVNPTLAYQPVPWVSVAGGLDVQYAKLRLTQAVDFGSICTVALGTAPCGAGFGLQPGLADGQADVSGESVGVGFTIGGMVQPIPQTRLAVAYRSQIDHHFSDMSQKFLVPGSARAFLAAGGTPLAFTGSSANTTLPLPARLTFGLRQQLTPDLDLLLDAGLTFWDVFKSLSVTANDPVTGASSVTQQKYRNSWRWAVALEYRVNDNWSLRTGVAYDQTPVPKEYVQAALPDRDRVYASVGASYKANDTWNIDMGYSHLFATGTVSAARAGPTGDTLQGHFRFSGDVMAAQIRYRF